MRKNAKFVLQCSFETLPEQPKLVISEGPERSVGANHLFTVSAANSIDMNVPPGQKGDLKFRWSCRIVKGPPSSFSDFCELDLGQSE